MGSVTSGPRTRKRSSQSLIDEVGEDLADEYLELEVVPAST